MRLSTKQVVMQQNYAGSMWISCIFSQGFGSAHEHETLGSYNRGIGERADSYFSLFFLFNIVLHVVVHLMVYYLLLKYCMCANEKHTSNC